MSGKRKRSEQNNNEPEPEMYPESKMQKWLKIRLESNLTEKMITPTKSTDGDVTSRFGRKITRTSIDSQSKHQYPKHQNQHHNGQHRRHHQSNHHNRHQATAKRPLKSKRKVRTVFSIHNISANASLRLVSNRQSAVLKTKSPIHKLISDIKMRLNNDDQFQTQPNEKNTTDSSTIDLSGELSVTDQNFDDQFMDLNMDSTDSLCEQRSAIDFEDSLTAYTVQKRFLNGTESFEIIDEIDLTGSPDSIEHGAMTDDDDRNSNKSVHQMAHSTTTESCCIHKTDMLKTIPTPPIGMGNLLVSLTDCKMSKSIASTTFDTNLYDDEPLWDNTSDDCVIASKSIASTTFDTNLYDDEPLWDNTSDDCVIADVDDDDNHIENRGDDDEENDNDNKIDSTDNWYVGQIVWAALPRFWPAMIFNCEDTNTFHKDDQIHVKFLHDNGRHSWVKEKSSIIPFKGLDDFDDKCKLSENKRKYSKTTTKSWELAVQEANVLKFIKRDKRVQFYDTILMNAVQKVVRANKRTSGERCDTPQTFDTAYSSMKQSSSSPAPLSPNLNEFNRKIDIDKNINVYLKSVEGARLQMPDEDMQMDETFVSSLNESPSSTEEIYCQLTKLVYDKLRDDDTALDQSAISNDIELCESLNMLWIRLNAPDSKKSTKRVGSSGRPSIDSLMTISPNVVHPCQTNRQKKLAMKRALEEEQKKLIAANEKKPTPKKQPTEEEIKLKQQQRAERVSEIIMSCCMKNHPANFFLKGLAKDPVCQHCLNNGNVMICAGKCKAYFHRDCFNSKINESNYQLILKQKLKNTDDESKSNESVINIIENVKGLKCVSCASSTQITCFVCRKSDDKCIQHCEKYCGKAYHIECLKYWPQHMITYESKTDKIKSLLCPRHVCHTCVSPDIRRMFHSPESDKKLIKCLLCPGTYHRSSECIPAGSELLSETQLICARHQPEQKFKHIDYCLLCSEGGTLVCCDTCANAFHVNCLNVPIGDHFICEECESGRRPLYGDIIWCRYGKCTWWPAIIVPPPLIPANMQKKEPNQICVFFFGTHDYGWVHQMHMYFYIADDGDCPNRIRKQSLKDAVVEAKQWLQRFETINGKNGKQNSRNRKPPRYKPLKVNKISAKFEDGECNECKCSANMTDPAPCSIESDCENVLLNIECDPNVCPAKEKCQNRNFNKGEQFAFDVKMTDSKGWGLFAKEEIPENRFIIEYMGEVIDSVEFDQRFNRAKANKDDNYYFMYLVKNMYIDAKHYGNNARFINHSCDPNAESNKWTVYSNGQEQVRIGIFAKRKILPGEEITFHYNWEKNMKNVCQCGSKICSGHI